MIRRTLIALSAVTMLGLAAIVTYVLLGLSGAETTVDDAVAAYDRSEFTRAIRLLDRAENSLGRTSDHTLRARILTLRNAAHLQVENLPRALDDIDSLIALGKINPKALAQLEIEPEQLVMDRIYYTLRNGDGEKSLQLAQEFLHGSPEHPRALELAGEATYEIFATAYEELRKELDRFWATEVARKADQSLKAWLYREETDPLARRGRTEFDAELEKYSPGLVTNGRFQARLENLRRLIQKAQDYCRRAIIAPGGQPVAAYQLLRTSLAKGKRSDDIQALAETYLLRFDHIFTVDAASDLAELHVSNGRFRAAREVADRFLPLGAWESRFKDGRLSSEVRRLYAAKAQALRVLRDRDGARELAAEVDEVQASGLIDLHPELHLIRAQTLATQGNYGAGMTHLNEYVVLLSDSFRTRSVRERIFDALIIKSEFGRILKWKPEFHIRMYKQMARAKPEDPEPLLRLVDLYLADSDGEQALAAARNARKIEAHNDDVLRAIARAHDFQDAKSGRSANDLLNQFIRLETVPNGIRRRWLWPLIAELAYEKELYEIAFEAAQNASDEFNWSRWPRLIEANAALRLGDSAGAIRAIESLLTFFPDDPEGTRLLEQARRAAGQPVDDLLYGALRKGREDAATARALLARARARGDDDLANSLAQTIKWRYREDPEALLMIADFFIEQGWYPAARTAIKQASEHTDSPMSELHAKTRASSLMIAAVLRDKKALPRLIDETKLLFYGKTEQLYRYAISLSQLHLNKLEGDPLAYELAYDLLEPILTEDVHRDARTGAHYELGGKIALRLGRVDAAREHLLSAMSFEDGHSASRILTLLYLRDKSAVDLSDVFWERRATDLVSAAIFARMGNKIAALQWAEKTLAKSELDGPALCLRALLDPSANPPEELATLVERLPDALMDVLTFLQADGFESVAVDRALALFQQVPQNRFAQLLFAKALANGGNLTRAFDVLVQLMNPSRRGDFVWAHEEAARLLEQSSVTDDTVVSGIIRPFLGGAGGLSTPDIRELGIRSMMFQLQDKKQQEAALEMLAQLWKSQPERVSLADILFLQESGRPELALPVLEQLERLLPPDERPAAHRLYFDLIETLDGASSMPEQVLRARSKAQRIISEEGAYGAVVHFLLRSDDKTLGPMDSERQDPDRVLTTTQLLDAHLQMFLTDRDSDSELVLVTLRRLAKLVDRTGLLDRTEAVLRHDPSLVPVWILRADWLVRDGRLEEAHDSVRWIAHYLPNDLPRLRIAEFAARNGEDDRRAAKMLSANLKELYESPAAFFTRGMIALRGAEYATATEHFEKTEPINDGAHLYFGALAELGLGDQAQARAKFAKLASDYPDSLLSENAEQFASFLSH